MKELVKSLELAITIFNAFHAGEKEDELLELRDFIVEQGEHSMPPVTVRLSGQDFTVSFQTVGYMVAAAKHLGDLCQEIGKLTPDEVRILKTAERRGNGHST